MFGFLDSCLPLLSTCGDVLNPCNLPYYFCLWTSPPPPQYGLYVWSVPRVLSTPYCRRRCIRPRRPRRPPSSLRDLNLGLQVLSVVRTPQGKGRQELCSNLQCAFGE